MHYVDQNIQGEPDRETMCPVSPNAFQSEDDPFLVTQEQSIEVTHP